LAGETTAAAVAINTTSAHLLVNSTSEPTWHLRAPCKASYNDVHGWKSACNQRQGSKGPQRYSTGTSALFVAVLHITTQHLAICEQQYHPVPHSSPAAAARSLLPPSPGLPCEMWLRATARGSRQGSLARQVRLP
jgi:hypothetical protein